MSDEKSAIRAEALRYRQNLNIDPDWSDQVAGRFFYAVPLGPDSIVSVYYPRGKELDTSPITEQLWAKKIKCALPVMEGGNQALKFSRWVKESRLIEGAFQIPVPEQPDYVDPDVVIVPLLVFDQRGHRLGYGKGYYDVTLKELRQKKAILAVGLAYAEQACLFALPAEEHDQKLDLVVTPQRVFDFRR
jgi:5-formyltetrahydrofolate cyclo-ligase